VPVEQGELGQLKSKYSSSITIVREIYPAWSAEDVVYALEENAGDLEHTIHRISEGKFSGCVRSTCRQAKR
jgi:CUE domain